MSNQLHAVQYDDDGQIIALMSANRECIELTVAKGDGNYLVFDEAPETTRGYVSNGKIVPIEDRSNDPRWKFDYGKKQWVADMELGKKFKLAEIDKAYEETVHEGFEVDGKQYSSTKEAQTQIQLAVSMQQESCAVTMLDGTCSMVTADEVKAIGAAMLKHLSNCIQRRSTAVAAINDAASVEDLDKVVF